MHPLESISFINQNQAYVIEASAGTGKTWTIERLFIKALLESKYNNNNIPIGIENILVVTFTNDATNELKQRIQEQIHSVINQIIILHNKPTPNDSANIFNNYLKSRAEFYLSDITILTRAYQNFDMASIYTIHGFCNKIIQDYQFECQVNTEFSLVESKSDIIEQLVRDFIRIEIINKTTHNLNNVINNLEHMFSSTTYDLTLEQRIVAKIPKDLFKINNNKYQVKYSINLKPSLDKLSLAELDDITTCKAEFLAELVAYLESNYSVYLAKINTISYDELIQKVTDALLNQSTLADKIFDNFPIAFIDEFQDTDSLQWQIFSTIYKLNKPDKRGTVVAVGDPKQAIYKFRGADVDTYIEARNQLNNKLELSSNFRSHANIMNFMNQLFSLTNQQMNIENSFFGKGIDYSEIKPQAVSTISLPRASILNDLVFKLGVKSNFYDQEVQLIAVNGKTKPERNAKLLQSLTFEILTLLKAEPELKGKIAILVTKNKEGSEIVQYLKKYGIKAAELKLGNIFATTTALNLYLFLNSIFDLTNRKNFIKAITTSLFNLPLPFLTTETGSANPVLQKLQENFFRYQQIWNVNGLISLVYALLNDLFNNSLTTEVLNSRELANIWQLSELLNNKHIENQTELLFWFKQKINNAEHGIVEDIDGNNEELIRLDNDDEQIIITTQHRAKGLEYEILFCPYFKNSATLDGMYDFNYQRPFFSNYRSEDKAYSEMVINKSLGEHIINNDNKESHRLNYVALTRAKSRIYIYLKQHTYTKSGSYNSSERPDKIVELFGYVRSNPNDNKHLLFNYSKFFGDNPIDAIKVLLPGVIAYNRDNLSDLDLNKLTYMSDVDNKVHTNLNYVDNSCIVAYTRQSYTALTKVEYDPNNYLDNDDVENSLSNVSYRFSILEDKILRGANFGTMFHALCEAYPFNLDKVNNVLTEYNIDYSDNLYNKQLSQMIDEAFSYPIIDSIGIKDLSNSIHELNFNLQITNSVSITKEISQIIAKYFGSDHPFTLASQSLGDIEKGFLVGFIDLFFEYNGKYWVLDYKTNTLDNYSSSQDIQHVDNPLIISMADHHYYLQYILYLVAVKRYLEQKLKLSDATHLIGGAIYYYVRGIYTDSNQNVGIFTDSNCANLIQDIDNLFKSRA